MEWHHASSRAITEVGYILATGWLHGFGVLPASLARPFNFSKGHFLVARTGRKEAGMREIISVVVIIASLLGGTAALKGLHDVVRKAALEKAAQGLPSLEGMSRALQQPSKSTNKSKPSL